MTRSCVAVVKVGGSLFDWNELPVRLAAFLDVRGMAQHGERALLVAGGGAAAELVRGLDRIHGLGDDAAHRLALAAMDLTALVLARLLPRSLLVAHIAGLDEAWDAGDIPIAAPRQFLEEIERSGEQTLPATWDVTSDSIAARVAAHLGARRLVLLKSAPLPAGTTRRDAARLGLVDPLFPSVSRALRQVEYLNLREPASRPELLPP